MGLDKHARTTQELLERHGTFVRKSQHGDLWRVGARFVCLPGTPGDVRSSRNTLGDVRRAVAALENGRRTAVEPSREPSAPTIAGKETFKIDPRALPSLVEPIRLEFAERRPRPTSLRVERSRKVVEKTSQKGTISLEDLARALELDVAPGDEVYVQDCDGHMLALGEVVIVVESTKESES